MRYRATSQGYEMEDGMVFKPYAAQDYAKCSLAPGSKSCAREMTAADLGLHPDFLRRAEQERALDATLARLSTERKQILQALLDNHHLASRPRHLSDAPYSFWLGASA